MCAQALVTAGCHMRRIGTFSIMCFLVYMLNGVACNYKQASLTFVGLNTLSKKVQFFQKCFILGQLKAYHRKQVDVFFILIPNLKDFEKLQMLPFINIQICSSITCSVQLNGFICNF